MKRCLNALAAKEMQTEEWVILFPEDLKIVVPLINDRITEGKDAFLDC